MGLDKDFIQGQGKNLSLELGKNAICFFIISHGWCLLKCRLWK